MNTLQQLDYELTYCDKCKHTDKSKGYIIYCTNSVVVDRIFSNVGRPHFYSLLRHELVTALFTACKDVNGYE